ncbi:MAG TPA: phosphate acyltransferase PlsX [Candidatus Omnitrophota bacterium]|nr:phosphate acyltransferase PlsX [Candidatus Omnitrophota bacterium]
MNIVVDAMGGDHAPEAIVAGVVEAVKEFDIRVTLVGVQERIGAELSKYNYPAERIEIIHAPEVVDMHEPATVTIRRKRDSSISVGIGLLKNPSYSAFISAGNTGACVAAATFILGMIPGVERPAIGIVIPTLKKFSFLIDLGANSDPKPEHLLQSAMMARVYVREVLGVASPTVGLINIGEEASKGTDFEKTTHKLMSEKLTNFIGNVEANEIYTGKSDCVVCDGFVGNVVLKVSEGLMESMGKLMKREIRKDPLAILGAFLMKWRLQNIKKLADYSEYGGAPLLCVNGVVMISHGRSSPKAIKSAIRATMKEVNLNILEALAQGTKDVYA